MNDTSTGYAYVDVSETLREVMSRNPFMKVFVANGYYDLATPYFATEYTFNHLGLDESLRRNVQMEYYEAGHMMYVHPPSMEKYREDLARFIRDQRAAVTVDWVVLTAAVLGLWMLAMNATSSGTLSISEKISSHIASQTVSSW